MFSCRARLTCIGTLKYELLHAATLRPGTGHMTHTTHDTVTHTGCVTIRALSSSSLLLLHRLALKRPSSRAVSARSPTESKTTSGCTSSACSQVLALFVGLRSSVYYEYVYKQIAVGVEVGVVLVCLFFSLPLIINSLWYLHSISRMKHNIRRLFPPPYDKAFP